jgi:hypothetical protein
MAHASLYLVAWPNSGRPRIDEIPQNATSLITDWQARFEPARLLRHWAPELLGSSVEHVADWRLTDRFVEVDAVNRQLLFEVACDTAIAEVFERSAAVLHDPVLAAMMDRDEYNEFIARRVAGMVGQNTDDVRLLLASAAIPILLGMAIIATASETTATYHAHQLFVRSAADLHERLGIDAADDEEEEEEEEEESSRR